MINEQIRDKEVRVIGQEGQQLGVMSPKDAMKLAREAEVVGDCENFPFENDSFDAIICSMSFHHYPNPQAFFDSVKRCLRPNGRLILRDVTSDNKVLIWLMNTLEMPLANICGHGDVQVPTRDVVIKCCRKAGLKLEKFEIRKGMRMHCVVRKTMGEGNR